MEDDIEFKSRGPRLIERIGLCVDSELKDLYDEVAQCANVAEDVRRYLRARLPEIKAKIAAKCG